MKSNRVSKNIFFMIVWTLFSVSQLFGQNEQALKEYFEGKMVTVKLDMPATQKGIDVYPLRKPVVNFEDYGNRIKEFGISVTSGQSIMVTKVRTKGKHIEFQLGGGGYGTFWDESDNVDAPYVDKSKRENQLDKLIKKETDSDKKKELRKERDELERDREKEQRRLELTAEDATQAKKARVREKASQAGSRFNVRYDYKLTHAEKTPESILAALAQYVDFSNQGAVSATATVSAASMEVEEEVVLHKGLLWEDVMQMYGMPKGVSERMEGTLKVITCSFEDDDNIIKMDFVESVLIKYTVTSK